MKQLIKKSLKFTKETQYLLYYCIAMFSLDFYLRFVSRTMKSYSCLYYIPNLFTVMWILIFALIIHVIKKRKAKRLLIAFSTVLFTILMFTNLIFFRLFSKFFTFKDILFSSEGLKYSGTIFGYINLTDLIVIIFVMILIVISNITTKYINNKTKKNKIIYIVVSCIIASCLIVQIGIGKSNSTTAWDAFSNKRNIYNQFNDTKRSLMLCGLYEYSFRDLYLTFKSALKKTNKADLEAITKYFESNNKNKSEYNGIFKDKNIILIMLEDIDTWMITK